MNIIRPSSTHGTILNLQILAILLSINFKVILGLECYVCHRQEDNKDKCVETVKTCDLGQDRCLTEVKWGGMPYWAPSGEKQYYISKRCSSAANCSQAIEAFAHRCDRIWYNDWECAECCHGDRCNYYVTLDGNSLQPTNVFTMVLAFVTFWILTH